MTSLPGWGGVADIAAGAPLPEVAFLQAATDTNNLTTYSFAAHNFGAADAARDIIVIACGDSGGASPRTIASATIGGVSATVIGNEADTGLNFGIGMILARVPTGTSGTVEIAWNAGQTECRIHTFRAVNIANATPFHTDTAPGTGATGDPATMSLNIPGGGIGVAGYMCSGTGDITVTGLGEDYDAVETAWRSAAASSEKMAAETGRTIEFEENATGGGCAICASWL